MTPFFSELGADDYVAFRDSLTGDIAELAQELAAAEPLATSTASDWADLLRRAEGVNARLGHVESYLGCATAADARNELAQREESGLASINAAFDKLLVAVRSTLGGADDDAFAALLACEQLKGAGYFLRRLRYRARHSMSRDLEDLAADLAVDGIGAWVGSTTASPATSPSSTRLRDSRPRPCPCP